MIVITGGAGFIGKHLVNGCLKNRERVTVIDKVSRPSGFPASSQLVYQQADAAQIARLLPKGKQSGMAIVHLAAETLVQDSMLSPLSGVQSNVELTCSVLEFARRVDAKCLVFSSSAAVYGERKEACSENDPPNPISPYAASKLSAEYYCRTYANLYGLPVRILRLFNVYGPEQLNNDSGVIAHFLNMASRGKAPEIYGNGRQIRDFVFIRDVIDAILQTLRSKLSSGIVMNIGSGKPVTINEVARKVIRLLQKDSLCPIYLPARPGDITSSLANISLARRKLGFQPQLDIDEGLRLTHSSLVNSQ